MTTLRMGLTKVEFRERELEVRITHNGNMGNSIADVRKNADKLLGPGVFDALRKAPLEENGSPDYEYMLVTSLETYMEEVAILALESEMK